MNEQRQEIADALQESQPEDFEGLLLGFVAVVEWVDLEGQRWLTRTDGNASGDPITAWQREGYLHNALNTDWTEETDE